jgi:hypothetical protein
VRHAFAEPCACTACSILQRKHFIHSPIAIRQYLVSPLVKRLPDSRYSASVSIRSGRGSHTHDRVLRLLPVFDCGDAAARYALDQGIAWLHSSRSPQHTEESAWQRKN